MIAVTWSVLAKLNECHECVFGSRFTKAVASSIIGIQIDPESSPIFCWALFNIRLNDTKLSKRIGKAIDGCRPLISPHFTLTVELPLKQLCGLLLTVIPITWRTRRTGEAKLAIKEMAADICSSASTFG